MQEPTNLGVDNLERYKKFTTLSINLSGAPKSTTEKGGDFC